MASKAGYRTCGSKYRKPYKDLWTGEVTRESLRSAIETSGGIKCLVDQWA